MVKQETKITIHIGKNGLTPEIVLEIKKQLKTKRKIKCKMLKSFIETLGAKSEKKLVAAQIAKETESQLEGITGFVFVLKRRGK